MAEPVDPEKCIIIVGASNDRSRFANRAVRAYRELGWIVYPVHPREKTVEGLACYERVEDVPGLARRLNLYVPAEVGMHVVEAAAGRGVRDVFVNPGAGSPALIEKIRSLGLSPIEACSIVAIGKHPSDYPA